MRPRSLSPVLRPAAGLLAGALALGLTASPASALPGFALDRLQGADRYATAAAIATGTFPDGTPIAIVARGDVFADALAANSLAGALGAPVLLTGSTRVPTATTAALDRLGVEEVVVVGGRSAVSATVERELAVQHGVTRLGGDDRYGTAALIATATAAVDEGAIGEVFGLRTAILGSGQNFPDVLAAAPLAYAGGHPLVVSRPDDLPASSAAVLEALDVEQVFIVGGTAAISNRVQEQVERIVGTAPVRIAGDDRYATAAAVAELAWVHFGFSRSRVDLARGDAFADALAGGPHAGEELAPLLLVQPGGLPEATKRSLAVHSDTLVGGHVLGGTTAVPRAVEEAAEAAGASPFDRTAPDLPVLTAPLAPASTEERRYTVTGTAEPGAVVRVLRALDRGPAAEGTADATTGAFSLEVVLVSEGGNDYLVTATDAAGNTSRDTVVPTITLTVDHTPPVAPVVTSPTAPTTTGAQEVVIISTGEPGGHAWVRTTALGGYGVASGPVDETGAFSVSTRLEDGPNDLVVAVSDRRGNTGPTTVVPTITRVVPAP